MQPGVKEALFLELSLQSFVYKMLPMHCKEANALKITTISCHSNGLTSELNLCFARENY